MQVCDPARVPPVDVVVLATKALDPNAVVPALRALLGPGRSLLTLQNGLGIEAALARATGHDDVLGGLCFICSNAEAPGRVRHLGYGRVTLGRHRADGSPAGIDSRMEDVASDLVAARIEAQLEADLVQARWKKLLWNVPFNALSVVLDALPHELLSSPFGRALVLEVMDEVAAGAAATGHPTPHGFADGLVTLTESMPPYATSMRLDFEAGRPLEIDAILGAPAAASRRAGQPLVRVEQLERQVRYLAGRRT